MSTPNFLPQDDTNYNAVRFYTALDPYFYSVDNRPLQDLEGNLKASRVGADSARRASAILGLSLSEVFSELFAKKGDATALSGLKVYKTSNSTVRVGPGAYYESKSINAAAGDLILKQALRALNTDFTVASPVSAGTSIVYTVEGQFIELTDANLPSSQMPYVDQANVYLSSVLIQGELRLSLLSGIASNTGSEQAPATTAGKFPIYNITVAQGATTFDVRLHPNAPRFNGMARAVIPVPLATGGVTTTAINEIPRYVFANAVTSGVILPSVLDEKQINPFMPIKVRMSFTSTVTGGNAAFRIRYKGFTLGELGSEAKIISAIEAVPITAAANGVQTYTTTINIPASEFAGFVSNVWSINKQYLAVIVERIGADASDTNTGDTQVMSITLVQ